MNELFSATEKAIAAAAHLDKVIAEVNASLARPFVPTEFEDLSHLSREEITARFKAGLKKQKAAKKAYSILYRKGIQAIKDAQAEANLAEAQVRTLR